MGLKIWLSWEIKILRTKHTGIIKTDVVVVIIIVIVVIVIIII